MKASDILAEKGTRVVTIHKDNLLVDAMSCFLDTPARTSCRGVTH